MTWWSFSVNFMVSPSYVFYLAYLIQTAQREEENLSLTDFQKCILIGIFMFFDNICLENG